MSLTESNKPQTDVRTSVAFVRFFYLIEFKLEARVLRQLARPEDKKVTIRRDWRSKMKVITCLASSLTSDKNSWWFPRS